MPDRLVVLPQHSEIDRCRDAWRADGLLRVVSEMLPNCSATVSVSITGLPCRPRNDLGSIRQHENVSSPPEIPSVNAAVWGLDAHSAIRKLFGARAFRSTLWKLTPTSTQQTLYFIEL